jgi:hypothetical protein
MKGADAPKYVQEWLFMPPVTTWSCDRKGQIAPLISAIP